MKLDPTVEPVVHPSRKIPHLLRSQLEKNLNEMLKQAVVERVDGPIDWVNSMVVVKKDGSLRICIDHKDLNKALKREHYQLPTIEEITARMAGARYFSMLDARSGYWQTPWMKRARSSLHLIHRSGGSASLEFLLESEVRKRFFIRECMRYSKISKWWKRILTTSLFGKDTSRTQ